MMEMPDGSIVFWTTTTASYTTNPVAGPYPIGQCPVCAHHQPQNLLCPYVPGVSCGGPAGGCPWCRIYSPIA